MVSSCEELILGGINRKPLAMGLLTDKYRENSVLPIDDVRGSKSPDWLKYLKNGQPAPEWLEKADKIKDILASDGRTVIQGVLAWLWGRSDKLIQIFGIRTVKQAKENCAAMQFCPLSVAQMQEIEHQIL